MLVLVLQPLADCQWVFAVSQELDAQPDSEVFRYMVQGLVSPQA